jgi:hypothetical protein
MSRPRCSTRCAPPLRAERADARKRASGAYGWCRPRARCASWRLALARGGEGFARARPPRDRRPPAPTKTGLGERRHLLSPATTSQTVAQDLIEHPRAEEPHDPAPVAHSVAGGPISAVAQRAGGPIARLVRPDAFGSASAARVPRAG